MATAVGHLSPRWSLRSRPGSVLLLAVPAAFLITFLIWPMLLVALRSGQAGWVSSYTDILTSEVYLKVLSGRR